MNVQDKLHFVLIHQMGKCGSQTIAQSIADSAPELHVERHHYLTEESWLKKQAQLCGDNDASNGIKQSIAYQMSAAKICTARLEQIRESGGKTCVISAYRDPLDCAISSIFQIQEKLFPQLELTQAGVEKDYAIVRDAIHNAFEAMVNNEIIDNWVTRRLTDSFEFPLKWFAEEFTRIHGIDLYQLAPNNRGLFHIQQEHVTYIIYRYENMHTDLPDILRLIPGIEDIVQSNRNLAKDKPHALLYRHFRESFIPTKAMENYFYSSDYFRHFYRDMAPRYSTQKAA